MEKVAALIVGLGNPGKEYESTRHNFGARVVEAFGVKRGLEFRAKRLLKGKLASGRLEERQVFLLLPTTYMNLSGFSVSAACSFYHLEVKNILVVSDETALPLGTLRYRPKGSAGGHNGLRNIEAQLGSLEYPRLRLGISSPKGSELSPYVLGRFTDGEEKLIGPVIDRADELITSWLTASEGEHALSRTVEVTL